MTQYCEIGNKPKVEYKKDGQVYTYLSDKSPIDIVLDKVQKNQYGDDYNAEGYTIQFSNGGEITVINHRTSGNTIQYWSCGSTDWDNRQADGTYPVWYNLPGAITQIDRSKGCPPPIPPQDYIIKISHEGTLLYSDRSANPITYDVICGNCPPGQHECKTNKYPGYCCISCQKTSQRIDNLRGKLHG
jgi:hypothetical protein